ncbi:MAG: alpha-2-macroglobulin family protein, partial [Rubripirellula sp.]
IMVDVKTTTIDGQGQSAKGVLEIYEVQQPEQVQRATLNGAYVPFRSDRQPPPAADNPYSWPLGDVIKELAVETDGAGLFQTPLSLTSGIYRAKFETTDRAGKKVTADLLLQVLDPDAEKLDLKIPYLFTSPTDSVEVGDEYSALWGSGYESARSYIEIEHRGKLLQSFWSDSDRTQQTIEQKVTRAMRGGFHVRSTMVRQNRAYTETKFVDVPWSNKELNVRWERFVSKLEPGAKETWTAIITGKKAQTRAAEMVATLYDASLDALVGYDWPSGFGVFRRDYSYVQAVFQNQMKTLSFLYRGWVVESRDGSLTYRHLPNLILQNHLMVGRSRRMMRGRSFGAGEMMADAMMAPAAMAEVLDAPAAAMEKQVATAAGEPDDQAGSAATGDANAPDLNAVSVRRNLDETAFFFPHLVSDDDGVVRMTFTMPEALTEWKFLGFAHDQSLRSGLLRGSAVTSKDLMVQPNPP